VLHDDTGRVRRPWQVKRWLVCVLAFKGRKRQVMAPGHYTELFFLDEATALAAGHRPCAECRRQRFLAFCDAWGSPRPCATEIDERLHAERVGADRSMRSFPAALDDLPDGVFVTDPAWGEGTWLLCGGELLAWSPGAYRQRRPRGGGAGVRVLTPVSTVASIRAGYIPAVHPSAQGCV
jgi:hypothetical protein